MGHPGGYTTLDYGGNPYQTTSHSTNRFLSSHGFQPDGMHARDAVEVPEFAPGGHHFLHGGSLRNLSAPCCLTLQGFESKNLAPKMQMKYEVKKMLS